MPPKEKDERSRVRSDSAPEVSGLWAGRGEGYPCTHCGRPVRIDETQYEIEGGFGQPSKRFHVGCYADWRASGA